MYKIIAYKMQENIYVRFNQTKKKLRSQTWKINWKRYIFLYKIATKIHNNTLILTWKQHWEVKLKDDWMLEIINLFIKNNYNYLYDYESIL